jgi:hypothetical protein
VQFDIDFQFLFGNPRAGVTGLCVASNAASSGHGLERNVAFVWLGRPVKEGEMAIIVWSGP